MPPIPLRAQLEAVLAREPTLNTFGFGLYQDHRREPPEAQAARLAAQRQQLRDDLDRVQATCAWITAHLSPRQTLNPRYGSYGLKHTVEHDIGYITNGAFIAGMLLCGYRHQVDGPNAIFNLSARALTRYRRARAY